jgi:restriction endonuclease Mrr
MSSRIFSPLKRKDHWNLEKFSTSLLEKEIELEKSYSQEVIEELITLYSEAIEHYNELSDPRFYDFQDKLHSLLLRPEVSSVLNRKNLSSLYSFSKRTSKQSQQLAIQKILERSKTPKIQIFSSPSNLSKSIHQNMKVQDLKLVEKLSLRKSQRQKRNSESFTSSTNSSYSHEHKNQLEKIMEKSFSEKSREISDVTLEYLCKIDEASEGSKKVLADEMKTKIIQISKVYDDKRRMLLRNLKSL